MASFVQIFDILISSIFNEGFSCGPCSFVSGTFSVVVFFSPLEFCHPKTTLFVSCSPQENYTNSKYITFSLYKNRIFFFLLIEIWFKIFFPHLFLNVDLCRNILIDRIWTGCIENLQYCVHGNLELNLCCYKLSHKLQQLTKRLCCCSKIMFLLQELGPVLSLTKGDCLSDAVKQYLIYFVFH